MKRIDDQVQGRRRRESDQARERFSRVPVKLSIRPFVAKAAATALAVHPVLNSSVSADNAEVTYHSLTPRDPGGCRRHPERGATQPQQVARAIMDLRTGAEREDQR